MGHLSLFADRHAGAPQFGVSHTISPLQVLLVTLATAALLFATMRMTFGTYDEAVIVQGAVEVGRGLVPHRDFYATYGPVQFWIIAGLFAVFGKTLIVARIYDIAVRTAIVLLSGLIARRLGVRPALAVGALLFEAGLMIASGFYLYTVFPTVVCALAGTLLLVGDTSDGRVPAIRMLAAGMLTALTALLRYDIGFFLMAAHVLALTVFHLPKPRSFGLLVRQAIVYALGIALVFLPVAAAAWVADAVPGFLHDIVEFPAANYVRMRSLPWPVPEPSTRVLVNLVAYVPIAAVLLGAVWISREFVRREPTMRSERTRLATALIILTALFFVKGLVRVSLVHSLLSVVPAILVLVFLIDRRGDRKLRLLASAVFAFALVLVVAETRRVAVTDPWRGDVKLLPAKLRDDASGEKIGDEGCGTLDTLRFADLDEDTGRAACFIRAHTAADEPIFVGTGRHDKIVGNNVGLYFASSRPAGTHWYHFDPGLQTQAEVQRAIIADLQNSGVRLIAIDTADDTVVEPNDSAKSSGVRLLDRFIRENSRQVARFGHISIRMLRSGAKPHDASAVHNPSSLTI